MQHIKYTTAKFYCPFCHIETLHTIEDVNDDEIISVTTCHNCGKQEYERKAKQ